MTGTSTSETSGQATTSTGPPRPPFWRDVRNLAWAFQLVVLAIVLAVIGILVNNVRVNSSNQGIPTGFDYLSNPSSFTIPGSSFRDSQPVSEALVVGVLNTVRVSVAGIILATLLGVLLGIGRLSGNFLVRSLSRMYVEFFRNIPLLSIVIFAYLAIVLTAMPRLENALEIDGLLIVSNRGVVVPWVSGRTGWFFVVLLVAAVAAWWVWRWRTSFGDRTGNPAREPLWALLAFVSVTVVGGQVLDNGITTPSLSGGTPQGGITLQPEYFALLVALTLYTASHIAEIVRGSIQAVPRGQDEASRALALSGWQRLRHVILPQAFRIALPPLGNQYLNLMKNSSLGFVISYFELTKVTQTSIGNRSPAVPSYLLLMFIYLIMSLIISAVVNVANRRLEVVGR
jgi:general L-amino acid transport system permease protein